MSKLDRKSRPRLIVVLLIAGSILLATLAIRRIQIKLNCSEIDSMLNAAECVGRRLEAIGILECRRAGAPQKAAVHYLRFADGTELRLLEEYSECASYDGKTVRVTGRLYRATEFDQSAGIGMIDVRAVKLAE
jgi:hypothetical protein